MSKLLFIGQAPAKGMNGKPPFSGRNRKRLAYLFGVEEDHLDRQVEFVNVLKEWPGKNGKGDAFPMRAAIRAAKRIDLYSRVVIFAGKQTARAFGITEDDYFHPHVDKRLSCTWMIVPHPSRVNRVWNDAKTTQEAMEWMRAALTYAQQKG